MSVPTVNSNSYLASLGSSSSGTSSLSPKTLTAQDFMQLLTVQMENQDPSTPMDSNQEMEQIVQISSMENMSTMSTDLTQMNAGQTWTLANSYLGRQVTVGSASGTNVNGVVTAIDTSGATPQVQINGNYYPITNVTNIQMAGSTATPVTSGTTSPNSG